MKVALQYLNDANGKTKAVKLSLSDWNKVITQLKKYEQELRIKSDLTEAFEKVALLSNSKQKKQTLSEFLNR